MLGSIDAARRTFTDLAALLFQALLGALVEAKAVAAARPAEPLAPIVADKRAEFVDGGKWQTRHLISATASVICAASARRLKGLEFVESAGPCPGRFHGAVGGEQRAPYTDSDRWHHAGESIELTYHSSAHETDCSR
jgi:hypothetical protein